MKKQIARSMDIDRIPVQRLTALLETFALKHTARQLPDLLEKTDYPIASISKQCGYVNSSKFARAFSTIMEVTPSKYRSHGRT